MKDIQEYMLDFIINNNLNKKLETYIHQNNISCIERLKIYQNNYFANIINNLKQVFSCIELLVSTEYFNQLAKEFVQIHPPKSGCLMDYGKEMISFIKTKNELQIYPFLTDIANLEWLQHEVYYSFAKESISLLELQSLDMNNNALYLKTNDTVRVLKSSYPIYDIWSKSASGDIDNIDMNKNSYILIYRNIYEVCVEKINLNEYNFINSLINNMNLHQAVENSNIANNPQTLTNYLVKYFKIGLFVK